MRGKRRREAWQHIKGDKEVASAMRKKRKGEADTGKGRKAWRR